MFWVEMVAIRVVTFAMGLLQLAHITRQVEELLPGLVVQIPMEDASAAVARQVYHMKTVEKINEVETIEFETNQCANWRTGWY
jgi:hypothetical protein